MDLGRRLAHGGDQRRTRSDAGGGRGAADGESLSETQVYAQALAAEGVPILVAAGDRWLLEEMSEGELGSARLLTTKEGQGRDRARSIDPAAAHAELEAAIAAALAAPLQLPPDHDSRLRSRQRHLGSLLATPVMRSKERH